MVIYAIGQNSNTICKYYLISYHLLEAFGIKQSKILTIFLHNITVKPQFYSVTIHTRAFLEKVLYIFSCKAMSTNLSNYGYVLEIKKDIHTIQIN